MQANAATWFLFGMIVIVWGGTVIHPLAGPVELRNKPVKSIEDSVATPNAEGSAWAMEMRSLDAFDYIAKRPVLNPDRTIAPQNSVIAKTNIPPKPKATPRQHLSKMILVGTIELDGGYKAIIKKTAQSDIKFFTAGDEVNGWKIADVDVQSVHFESHENEKFILRFPDAAVR